MLLLYSVKSEGAIGSSAGCIKYAEGSGAYAKLSKCKTGKGTVTYLGHEVGTSEVRTIQGKI